MKGRILFQMDALLRNSIIKSHLFYVEQARRRLLSQFDDIGSDVDRAADEWLEQSGQDVDPERYDTGAFYERANDIANELYVLLTEMREQTLLSVVAGMFHKWDKQLRDWLVHEIKYWHQGREAVSKVWSVDFCRIADLLESFGWRLRSTDYFCALDACRLVVNVYKHGEGNSLDELKSRYPGYLRTSFAGDENYFYDKKYIDYTHLKVSDKQFHGFSDAIVSFWRDVPENVFYCQLTSPPDWFKKAISSDSTQSQPTGNK